MKDLREQIDEIPVTLVVALIYVTLMVLTNPFAPQQFLAELDVYGWLTPTLAANGEPWRLLTSAFLHGGEVHLLVNLASLFAIGPALERTLGSVRFTVLYLVAAIGGNLAVCLLYEPLQPVLGGSGALFGMFGAAVAINVRSGRHALAFLDFEGPRRLIGSIVLNLAIGFALPFISNTAHLGGLVAGFLVTLLWLDPGRERNARLWQWRAAGTALFAGMLFASLMPVTRYDWLFHAARSAPADQRPALRRAMTMAGSGKGKVSDFQAQAWFQALMESFEADQKRRHRR